MWENTDQKKIEFAHFSPGAFYKEFFQLTANRAKKGYERYQSYCAMASLTFSRFLLNLGVLKVVN